MMKIARNRLTTGLVSLVGFFYIAGLGSSAYAASANIAVVDVGVFQQQFMTEVNTKLESTFKSQQTNLQKLADKFKQDQEKFQKDGKIMSAQQSEELKKSLIAQQTTLQTEAQKFEENVVKKRQEELKSKLDSLMQVVSNIAKGQYDMVLAKNVALFVDPKFDITQQVVDGYKQANTTKTARN